MSARFSDIEEYALHLQPWMQKHFQDVRMILLTFPEISEKLRYNTPFYDCAGRMMLYLSSFEKKRLVLGFCNGHLMPDEAGILTNEKQQTQIRHWELRQNSRLDKKLLITYIQNAIIVNQQLALAKHANNKNSKRP